jgi:hypothetical protein
VRSSQQSFLSQQVVELSGMKVMILGWVRIKAIPEIHYIRFDNHRCFDSVITESMAEFLKKDPQVVVVSGHGLVHTGADAEATLQKYWEPAVVLADERKSDNQERKRSAEVTAAERQKRDKVNATQRTQPPVDPISAKKVASLSSAIEKQRDQLQLQQQEMRDQAARIRKLEATVKDLQGQIRSRESQPESQHDHQCHEHSYTAPSLPTPLATAPHSSSSINSPQHQTVVLEIRSPSQYSPQQHYPTQPYPSPPMQMPPQSQSMPSQYYLQASMAPQYVVPRFGPYG